MTADTMLLIAIASFALPAFALWRAHVHERRSGGKCRRKYDH